MIVALNLEGGLEREKVGNNQRRSYIRLGSFALIFRHAFCDLRFAKNYFYLKFRIEEGGVVFPDDEGPRSFHQQTRRKEKLISTNQQCQLQTQKKRSMKGTSHAPRSTKTFSPRWVKILKEWLLCNLTLFLVHLPHFQRNPVTI